MIHDLNIFNYVFPVCQDKYITSVSDIKSFNLKYQGNRIVKLSCRICILNLRIQFFVN